MHQTCRFDHNKIRRIVKGRQGDLDDDLSLLCAQRLSLDDLRQQARFHPTRGPPIEGSVRRSHLYGWNGWFLLKPQPAISAKEVLLPFKSEGGRGMDQAN